MIIVLMSNLNLKPNPNLSPNLNLNPTYNMDELWFFHRLWRSITVTAAIVIMNIRNNMDCTINIFSM